MIHRDRFTQVLQLIAGTVIFLAVVAAWLWGKLNDVDTTELIAFAVPVVGALFLVGPLTKASDAAQQAVAQTNGMLDARIEASVSKALANRDAARTWQAVQPEQDGHPAAAEAAVRH